MNAAPKKILIVAGDTSGDIHCALLAREILSRHPDWTLLAAGGEHLRGAGCRIVASTQGMGVIGLASALAIVPRALKVRRQVLASLRREKPDAVVLCDWGAFNMRLLPGLREAKARSLYYFPPRSWQKHGDGGIGVATLCDVLATPFEWSAQKLVAAGGNAVWVGHPLLEIVGAAAEREATRAALGVDDSQVLVALMPGSRDMELRCIGPAMHGASRLVLQQKPNARFVAVVPRGSKAKALKYLPGVEVREGEAAALLKACDAALVKSGTATLEASVAGAPQIVCYDVPPIARAQWKLTLAKKISRIAMPNIILDRTLVPEMLGDNCRPDPLARELLALLDDAARRDEMRAGYREVRRALGEDLGIGATARTADLLEELLR